MQRGGRYDVIVAGGGTGGSVVAGRLASAGRRVLLLEAGPDYGPFAGGRWPAELIDATTIPDSHDWGYSSEDAYPDRVLPFERARVIGGSSTHNGCTVSWGHRADYDGWAARGLHGWSADDLVPLFEEASRRMRVRRFPPDEVAPLHRSFIDAGIGLGFRQENALETLDATPSVCAEPSNSPSGVRWNAAFAYLDPVRALPELEVRGDALVDRVLLHAGRAAGVRAIGPDGPFEALADLVVVTGGTYGSPAVLLRSGLGPAEELRAIGIEITTDLPVVGANLHDHPGFELFFTPTEELGRRTSAFAATGRAVPDEQGFAIARSGMAGDVFDLHVFSEIALNGMPAVFSALLTPRSRGKLRLRSPEPATPPSMDHAYLSDADGHDLSALLDGVELARSFASTPQMSPLLARETWPGTAIRSRAQLAEVVVAGVIHYWHPVGTCAMGADDDPLSVCDANGRVRGVDGLVVADASLMPATVRATTNIPTVVVAERIARALTV